VELVEVSFRGYKAFREGASIELRPLTLLTGKRGSGKTAAAQLPLLLAEGMEDRAVTPLPLEMLGVSFGGTLLDLFHDRRPNGAVEIGATFADHGARHALHVRVQHDAEADLAVVSRLELRTADGLRHTFEHLGGSPACEPPRYRIRFAGGEPVDVALHFNGLRPRMTDLLGDRWTPLWHATVPVLHAMNQCLKMTIYEAPFRPPPLRLHPDPESAQRARLGRTGGVLAGALLGSDASHIRDLVVRLLNAWYRDSLGQLDVVGSGRAASLVVRAPDAPVRVVDPSDLGKALGHALPLAIVELAKDARLPDRLEIFEQPELHLPPDAHPVLADLFVLAAAVPGAQILVETCSEPFLQRLRHRIAEHRRDPTQGLDPGIVKLYAVEPAETGGSRITPIEILPEGEAGDGPEEP
jgi:hypothetical protein